MASTGANSAMLELDISTNGTTSALVPLGVNEVYIESMAGTGALVAALATVTPGASLALSAPNATVNSQSVGSFSNVIMRGSFASQTPYMKVLGKLGPVNSGVATIPSGGRPGPTITYSGTYVKTQSASTLYTYWALLTSGNFVVSGSSLACQILVVGGGGAGGGFAGGGGGAGGASWTPSTTLSPATYTITVGAGGASIVHVGNNNDQLLNGNNGQASTFDVLYTGAGGGGGAGFNNGAANPSPPAVSSINGGCGGGASDTGPGGTGSPG